MSSMVELVVAAVALASACIFLAHAIEAYHSARRQEHHGKPTLD
jgi:hypothetical protein